MGEVVVSSEDRMEVELETEEVEKNNKKNEYDDGNREEVSWETFLPRMVIRVLLVEADDSTRQIITALLRKCNYSVVAVRDGLKAWETLKRKPHDIDLILTEVELPSISGFALLTLVMKHHICKNVPVIMMSSRDSISLVLKCMLKGATDFLIKPVRRNELRNLWQHVWRRHALGCHGSPNLTLPQKNIQATSENNSASNDSSDCLTSTQKDDECIEKGTDAQGLSQLKCGSASVLSDVDKVNHEKSKTEKELAKHDSQTREKSIRFISEAALCSEASNFGNFGMKEDHGYSKTVTQEEVVRLECSNTNMITDIDGCKNEPIEHSRQAIDLIGTFGDLPKTLDGNCSFDGSGTNKFDFAPQLELSLRQCPYNPNKQAADEQKTSNRSNASAFSWYGGSKLLQPLFQTMSSSSAKVNDDTSDSHESSQLSEDTMDASQQCDDTSNSHGILTTAFTSHSGAELELQSRRLIAVPGVRFDNIGTGYSHVFPSMIYTQSGTPPEWSPKTACKQENSPFPTSASLQCNPEMQNSEQCYQWSDGASYNLIDQTVHEQNNLDPIEEVRRGSPAAGHSASNSLCNGAVNHFHGSAYGSIFSGSDGNTASALVLENGPQSLNDNGHDIHDGLKTNDPHRFSQREAALTKFRLKRKDRCYEKKVRYQSRKRLAEQRPRVKGQFVRHVHTELPLAGGVTGS
ncbi:Two-component response regulator [Quillaja saponaria]|uniref:Two-component response regulator n=1 Tax=Quillaja saponaria TaxID=32244 RepID=A0AAD7L505_QUISA|nr:Two-component response regulator [Quillaja saponaria]KAJ7951383.1 Two-component response regulator [Quillaja saponaria]